MKKILTIVIFFFLLVGVLSFVSAQGNHQKEVYSKMTNIFSKIKYAITHGFFFFTSWGQENGCSTYPDWEGWIRGSMDKPTYLSNSVSCSKVGKNKCAIDIWYDNALYIGTAYGPPSSVNWNNWLKEVGGTGVSFSGSTYSYYYVQIYGCPDTPPPPPDHDTKVYVCDSGNWALKGYYEKGEYCKWDTSGYNRCWCSDDRDNFYVSVSGTVHCQRSSYSSVTDGSWCYVQCTPKFTWKCSNNNIYWYDSCGNREDVREYCSDGCVSGSSVCNAPCNTDADTNCDGVVDRDELGSFITKWMNGQVTRTKLGEIIMAWVGS